MVEVKVMRAIAAVAVVAMAAVTLSADVSSSEGKRIEEAATVLREIHNVPDKDIPQDLWDKAECVVVVPGLKKAAFVVGGEYGKGVMSCRHEGAWTPPIFMEVGKGSWGLQIGAQSIDLVFLVMNRSGMEKLLRNKVSLGVEASVAAGPVGRDARAATDVQMKAEILSYSRTQGLFAGVNISGGVVKANVDDNADMYGAGVSTRHIVMDGGVPVPAAAQPFMHALNRNSSESR
jgi:SH3 domain-containing YSC84-like protein 1